MKTKTTSNPVNLCSRTATGSRIIAGMAVIAFSLNASAQNTTFSASAFVIGGSSNAVFGGNSMSANIGGANTAVGWNALQNNTSGGVNTAVGVAALIGNTTGANNTAMGVKCMDATTTGQSNCAFGSYALNVNTLGTLNSAFGFQANVASNSFTNATAIGANAITNAPNRLWLGNMATTVWTTISYNVSDARFKRNIDSKQVKGLEFIKLLRPVTYNFDGKSFNEYVTRNMPADIRKNYLNDDFADMYNITQSGFIAQEVEQAAKASGYNFSGVHAPQGETDTYGISYYQFVVPLVKAVQEQQQMIDDQKAVNENLQQQIADLQKALGKTSGTTGINQLNISGSSMSMAQNVPNPFTHETTVNYTLPETVNAAYMAVYDLSGKQLASFPITQKGSSALVINSDKLSAGIYIYNIVADGKVFDSKKMIVADK